MKKILCGFLCICILSTFIGCGQQQASQSSATAKAPQTSSSGQEKQDQVKGKMVFSYWEDIEGSYKFYADLWNKKNPNVTLELQPVGWNSYHDTLITACASGAQPDMFKIQPTWIPELVSLNAIAPVDTYVNGWTDKNNVPEGIWKIAQADQDKLYSFPHSLVVLYLYCRKSYFKNAGIEYPKTMDEFYDACKKLTRDTNGDGKTDVYGFGLRGARGGHFMWAGLTMNNGGSFFGKDGSVTLNSPEMVEANKKYIEIYKNGWAPKDCSK